jgi:succinate dehydrogenase / fumarate reductase, membrane anchor subunit
MNRGTRGLKDFAIQRISAVYAAVYVILLFAYLAFHPHLHYRVWEGFFHVFWVQVPTLIFLVLILWHAWIGMWTVLTDYVKIPTLRILLELAFLLVLFVYFFWGVQIIWNIPLTWVF